MDYPIAAIDQHQRIGSEHKQMRGRFLSRPFLKRREADYSVHRTVGT
jgi:hypothetical protein